MIFTDKEQKAIEAAVKEAEEKTSGEIVPVVVPSSADYSYLSHRLAMAGLLIGTGCAFFLAHSYPFLDFLRFGAIQATGWGIGWYLGQLPFVLRFFLSDARMAEEVHESAFAAFARHGLHNTQDRTGILIYISELEHRVEILADTGIHQKVGEGYWVDEVEKIIAGIREKKAAAALCAVIREIGEKLSENFPKPEGDKNQIGDQLRLS